MRYYELTFIVDPLLPNDEAKQVADSYLQFLQGEGCELVHFNEWGVKQLAYQINKRNTGFYYTIEIKANDGNFVGKLEVAFRRDERVMRFLCMALDKFGVQYNADKRAGLIGKKKKTDDAPKEEVKATVVTPAPAAVVEAPVVEAPVVEEAPVVVEETPVVAEAVVEEVPTVEEVVTEVVAESNDEPTEEA